MLFLFLIIHVHNKDVCDLQRNFHFCKVVAFHLPDSYILVQSES